jgi:hypothetical protein
MKTGARYRRPTRRETTVAAVAAIVVITTGVLIGTSRNPRPEASPGPSGSAPASPGDGEAAWAGLTLAPLAMTASLEATDADPAGVAVDSAFILQSLTGEAAAALASRIEVSPPIELASAEAGANADTVTLRPTAALVPNQVYRFRLHAPDGSLAGSWAYRVRGPVAVLSTLPGNATQGVPIDTGIEVTFNQEGVADMADHFSISPAASGRFERHGLTQVFVPDGLKVETLYTVTIRAGLARTGADLPLASEVVFRFETSGGGGLQMEPFFAREVIESSPAERPIMAILAPGAEASAAGPPDAEITVYRLPSLDRATGVLADFLAQPHWALYSNPLMPTAGLATATTFTAKLEPFRGDTFVLRFPDTLPAGWYIVQLGGTRPAQAFLQVTSVSAWVSVLTDRTVVWANDVVTGRALAGATVAVADGTSFASSDATGLAVAATPAELIPPGALGEPDTDAPDPILRVTSAAGDVVLVPFGVAGDEGYRGEWWEKTAAANEIYWSMLFTDRYLYRSDDHVELWGYLRNRDDASVPPSVELRLTRPGTGAPADRPAIVKASATLDATGSFTASLPLLGIPTDAYELQAVVDGEVVVSRWLEVAIIRKPPYQLEVSSDHAAVLSGEAVNWTVQASFFDTSPAAGIPLTVYTGSDDSQHAVTTDGDGSASLDLNARTLRGSGDQWEDARSWSVQVNPTGPESAEISAGREVLVFPTAYDLTASGVMAGGELGVSGTLALIDLAKVERAMADGTWAGSPGDAAGTPVGGKSLQVAVTELIPVKRLVSNDYDFVEKVVRPHYEYSIERKPLPPFTVDSGSDGRIAFSLAIPDASHDYEVILSTTDPAGRVQRRTIIASSGVGVPWWLDSGPVFQEPAGTLAGETGYGVGDEVTWQIADGGQVLPSGGDDRYLYLVAQRGLRSAAVTASSTFRHAFAAADAPGIFVIGVRFTGTTYAPKAATWANFDAETRSINVAITADRERYRPGEPVTLSVVTTNEAGRPIPAKVVLQGVDEKLYAMNGASTPRPLENLYNRVDSGIVRLTSTHQVPTQTGLEGEGGDTTGGGRSDFRDTLFFTELTTDTNGRATMTTRLSDDLTSWHVAGSAITASLEAGVGELLVPVGLPFFVEATVADAYLASDRPAIELRAFGESLKAGDPVEFTVASTGLGLAPTRVRGTAFQPVRFELPALVAGKLSIDITATSLTRTDASGKSLSDRLIQAFEVVESRLSQARTAYGTIGASLPALPDMTGLTTYTFSDAGRGRFLPRLLELAQPSGARLDRAVAQTVARSLLIGEFGRDPGSLPPFEIDLSEYPIGAGDEGASGVTAGAALLPYGGLDPWLATRLAIDAPEAVRTDGLRDALVRIRQLPSAERDLAIAATAGLASIGEPVLGDLYELRGLADLTPLERIYLALGFEALGDDASAIAIERDLLAEHGQQLGASVRLGVGNRLDDILEATSLLSVVAAGLGDPLANALADYVEANPGIETTHALDLVASAGRMLVRTPTAESSFAYSVDGQRHEVALGAGESFSLELTAAQRSSLSLEAHSGRVGVTIEGRTSVEVAALRQSDELSVERTIPANIPADRLVTVDLTVTFAATAPTNGCYVAVELVPSGLAPLAGGGFGNDPRDVIRPSRVSGQEVTFCAPNESDRGHIAHLRYTARVVNEGTFTWEPAIVQLARAPEMIAFTPPTSVVVGRP